jgi:hypothetical protein
MHYYSVNIILFSVVTSEGDLHHHQQDRVQEAEQAQGTLLLLQLSVEHLQRLAVAGNVLI